MTGSCSIPFARAWQWCLLVALLIAGAVEPAQAADAGASTPLADGGVPVPAPRDAGAAQLADAAPGALDAALAAPGSDATTPPRPRVSDAGLLDAAPDALDAAGEAGPDAALDAAPELADAALDAGLEAAAEEAGVEPAPIVPHFATDAGAVVEAASERPEPVAEEKRPELAIRTVLGLLVLLALAYVGGHPRVHRIEESLGLRSAISAGFPFVALGLVARHPALGLVSPDTLDIVRPLVEFALGWLGFLVGLRFDVRAAEQLPKHTVAVATLETLAPFAATGLACSGAIFLLSDSGEALSLSARHGVILATAAAMTAPLLARRTLGAPNGGARDKLAGGLDEVVGVVGLTLVAAYFRPRDLELSWDLPGTVWLFIAIGMGAVLGGLTYAVSRRTTSEAESMAVVLGAVALAAGMAAYVALSPMVVCFVAAIVLANLPGAQGSALRLTLGQLERPIYLVFLVLVGALWDPVDWRGWVLMLVFVTSRLFGLTAGIQAARSRTSSELAAVRAPSAAMRPLSVVSIAVVVSVQILYQARAIPWLLTAVIGGAVVWEVLAQIALRSAVKRGSLPPPPKEA